MNPYERDSCEICHLRDCCWSRQKFPENSGPDPTTKRYCDGYWPFYRHEQSPDASRIAPRTVEDEAAVFSGQGVQPYFAPAQYESRVGGGGDAHFATPEDYRSRPANTGVDVPAHFAAPRRLRDRAPAPLASEGVPGGPTDAELKQAQRDLEAIMGDETGAGGMFEGTVGAREFQRLVKRVSRIELALANAGIKMLEEE